ncbi:hypothetical protein NMY22_g6981 [Coprinellus aureogranulatus]|nr:hypothetical protein NMY22_g6981 [Coprinellus aureogranulatus]
MAGFSAQNEVVTVEPMTGNSLLTGASAFKFNEATLVGGNMGTTVHVVLPRNDTPRVWSRRKELGRRASRRSQSVDVRPVSPLSLPYGIEEEILDEPTGIHGRSPELHGRCCSPPKISGDARGDLPDKLLTGIPRLTTEEMRSRELKLEKQSVELQTWATEAEEAFAQREQSLRQRERNFLLLSSAQEAKVQGLQKALDLKEEDVQLRERKLQEQITQWEVHSNRRTSELENAEAVLKARRAELDKLQQEVDEKEERLKLVEASLDSRIKNVHTMEDDIRSRRREELRRQLGDGAADLLRYTTIELQNAFGGDAGLGVHRIINEFDFAKIDLVNCELDDGLRVRLAPLYDKIEKRDMEIMSSTLKVAIAGVIAALQKNQLIVQGRGSDWLAAENLLMTTPHIQPVGERVEYHEDVEIARELEADELPIVAQWFRALVESDSNLSGATLGVFAKFPDLVSPGRDLRQRRSVPEEPSAEKRLLDVTVLWFPGHVRRSFKLSRTLIKIRTRQSPSRFGRPKRSTILSVEHCIGCTYHPRESFIKQMTSASRQVAIGVAERLFDFM